MALHQPNMTSFKVTLVVRDLPTQKRYLRGHKSIGELWMSYKDTKKPIELEAASSWYELLSKEEFVSLGFTPLPVRTSNNSWEMHKALCNLAKERREKTISLLFPSFGTASADYDEF